MADDRPVSQQDIARHLGLGQKTVSRVLGGSDMVSPTTRKRVLKAASELGYRPHASARALRSGRTGSVILLQSNRPSASGAPLDVIAGISEALTAANINLLLTRFDDQRLRDPSDLPKALRELTGDGIIVNYDTDTPEQLSAILHDTGLPTIWLNRLQDTDCVRPNDTLAGAMLAQHLIAAGHRRLAWTDLHLSWTGMLHYSREHRRNGFINAARQAGVAVQTWIPDQSIPDPATWYQQRMSQATGVGCYGETEFLALLRAATKSGVQVPEALSITGVQCSLLTGMPVDGVHFDFHALGHAAATMLLRRIEDPNIPLPTELISPMLTHGSTVSAATLS